MEDIQGGTTPEGIHLGAMAGTVDLLTRCFTGMDVRDGILWFAPSLPEELGNLHMHMRFRGHYLSIDMETDKLTIHSLPCTEPPIRIGHEEEVFELASGQTREFMLNNGP